MEALSKVYIDNTNLIFALAEENPKTGNIRETFFFNQMRVKNNVYRSEKGDLYTENSGRIYHILDQKGNINTKNDKLCFLFFK